MKILLVSGHTSGYNACKSTGVNEGDLNIELVKKIKSLLSKYAEVDVYPYDRDMYKDIRDSRCQVSLPSYRYILEVHFNAYDGSARGTSIQIHSNYKGGISVEQGIIDNVSAIGFKKRGTNGIVRRNDLLNMNTCLRLGIDYALIETCFYDSVADMNVYRNNKDNVAKAIVNGIVNGFGINEGSHNSNSDSHSENTAVGVVCNCYKLNVREEPNGKLILGILDRGDTVNIIGTGKDSDGDTWYKVQKSGLIGYVWPKYIQKK